jgi:hypothetical protein
MVYRTREENMFSVITWKAPLGSFPRCFTYLLAYIYLLLLNRSKPVLLKETCNSDSSRETAPSIGPQFVNRSSLSRIVSGRNSCRRGLRQSEPRSPVNRPSLVLMQVHRDCPDCSLSVSPISASASLCSNATLLFVDLYVYPTLIRWMDGWMDR